MAHNTSLLALLLVGACNTATPQTSAPDAPVQTPPPDAYVIPGAHYQYVIDRLDLPTNPGQLTAWSVDLDGVNGPDNVLGNLFAVMANHSFMISTPTKTAVDRGKILALIDLQAADFQNAAVVGVQVFHGADPIPAACSHATDVLCRHHLDGSGHFSIATDDPHHPTLMGSIQAGELTTTTGDLALQISLGTEPLIDLPLTDVQLQFHTVSATAIGSDVEARSGTGAILGGAVRMSDMTTFFTQLATAGQVVVQRDCGGVSTGLTPCGCTASSAGAAMITLFDTNKDCAISPTDLDTSPALKTLVPDITLPDATMAVSIGLGVHAVPATFTLP